jgi:hypothetical protein
MPNYAYCVLAFARPAKVLNCVNSIRSNDPRTPILLFVDFAVDCSLEVLNRNRELVQLCATWKSEGLIDDFMVANENLVTKNACYTSLQWGLKEFDYIALIEDDLIMNINSQEYIQSAIIKMEGDSKIGMACLYTSRNHSFIKKETTRLTLWPEMWGSLIGRRQFNEIFGFISKSTSEHVDKAVHHFSIHFLKSNLSKFFQSRFRSTWMFKYTKARNSLYAWDTEWQFALWALKLYSIAPLISLVRDTGTDFTSVSPNKKDTESFECRKYLPIEHNGNILCRTCERRREHQNNCLPSKLLSTPVLGKLVREGVL